MTLFIGEKAAVAPKSVSSHPARASFSRILAFSSLLGSVLLSGCGGAGHHLFGKTTPIASPNSGIVVTDEPQAALVGRDILARGGNAADAATATAFALSVTLPSRASLGGGGACLVSQPHAPVQMISFLAPAATGSGDRPSAVPMMARGFYLLQLHYGNVQFAETLSPAIDLARYGVTVSQALANDLAAVRGPLMADNIALSTFGKDDGSILSDGDHLVQSRLTSFLARLKLVGVGDLYNGALSTVFLEQANEAGSGITREDLRHAIPQEGSALSLGDSKFELAFLAPPADGGIGAAMAYKNGSNAEQNVAAWRAYAQQSGIEKSGKTDLKTALAAAQKFLQNGKITGRSGLPALPASTSFVVSDQSGMAVACALTENNLFGTGRIAGSSGVVLAASPRNYPQPLLSAAIARSSRKGQFIAALAASGQNDAAQEVANALRDIAQRRTLRATPTSQGRLNAILCDEKTCHGSTDSRGNGLSTQTLRK